MKQLFCKFSGSACYFKTVYTSLKPSTPVQYWTSIYKQNVTNKQSDRNTTLLSGILITGYITIGSTQQPIFLYYSVLLLEKKSDASVFLILSTIGHYSLFPLLFTQFGKFV